VTQHHPDLTNQITAYLRRTPRSGHRRSPLVVLRRRGDQNTPVLAVQQRAIHSATAFPPVCASCRRWGAARYGRLRGVSPAPGRAARKDSHPLCCRRMTRRSARQKRDQCWQKNFWCTFAPPHAVWNDLNFFRDVTRRVGGLPKPSRWQLLKDANLFSAFRRERRKPERVIEGAMAHAVYRCAELHSESHRQ